MIWLTNFSHILSVIITSNWIAAVTTFRSKLSQSRECDRLFDYKYGCEGFNAWKSYDNCWRFYCKERYIFTYEELATRATILTWGTGETPDENGYKRECVPAKLSENLSDWLFWKFEAHSWFSDCNTVFRAFKWVVRSLIDINDL